MAGQRAKNPEEQKWSGRRESNPRDQFGKLEFYH